jgi:hypothetical protein
LIGDGRLQRNVSGEPANVPLYEGRTSRDEGYRAAEREERAYLAVEYTEEQYAVTYDLLPAGAELAGPARKELAARVTQTVEEIVGDSARPTTEVSKSISASLGSVGPFEREQSAREVAGVIAALVLEEDNWVDSEGPDSFTADDLRRN